MKDARKLALPGDSLVKRPSCFTAGRTVTPAGCYETRFPKGIALHKFGPQLISTLTQHDLLLQPLLLIQEVKYQIYSREILYTVPFYQIISF